MRQSGHVLRIRRGRGAIAANPVPQNDTEHYQARVLMFSREKKFLQVKRRAFELAGHLDQAEIGPSGEIYSEPVLELRNEIQSALDHRSYHYLGTLPIKTCAFCERAQNHLARTWAGRSELR